MIHHGVGPAREPGVQRGPDRGHVRMDARQEFPRADGLHEKHGHAGGLEHSVRRLDARRDAVELDHSHGLESGAHLRLL